MPTQEADQPGLKELTYLYEMLGLMIVQWREYGEVPPEEEGASWVGRTPKRAWENGYARGYTNCADALEFALSDYLEGSD